MIQILKSLATVERKRIKAGSIVDFKYKVVESEKTIIFKLSNYHLIDKVKHFVNRNKHFSDRINIKITEEDWLTIKKPIDKNSACGS